MKYQEDPERIYFNNLDALRFIAFLSVFISHVALFLGYASTSGYFESAKRTFLIHGDLGVNFFFVLSGFLITFLLLREKDKYGHISLCHFYLRRILRIWPLYFLTLIIGFFVAYPLALKSGVIFPFLTTESYGSLPWYLFLSANIKMAYIGAGSVVLAVLWSISVEEQFYLIWPTILSFFHNRRNISRVILFIVGVAFLYRFYYYDNYNIIKYSTFSVMSDLSIGALGAYITFFGSRICGVITACPKYIIIFIYILGFALVPLRTFLPVLFHEHTYRFIYSVEPILFSLFFIFIILEQNLAKNSFIKFGSFKIINYLGVRSYGLYCYHMIAIFFTFLIFHFFGVSNVNFNLLIYISEIIIAFISTIIFSIISYRFFEKRFLGLKERYGYKNVLK